MKQGFTPDEVAERLGVCRDTIYREIQRAKLGAVKVGRYHRVTLPDLEAYLGRDRARSLFTETDHTA